MQILKTYLRYYQLGVNNRFHDQIQCNREWLHLLQDMLNMITSVTQTLGEIKIECEHFIATLNDAMTVNAETIAYRDSQLGGDSFNDEVQTELYKVGRKRFRLIKNYKFKSCQPFSVSFHLLFLLQLIFNLSSDTL